MNTLLTRHLEYLQRKAPRVELLRRDLKADRKGVRTHFVVDYSELHSYLYFASDAAAIESRIDFEDDRHIALTEFQLGLTHLFRSRADRVFLLPPHAREAWSHLVARSITREDVDRLEMRIRTSINALEPSARRALEVLSRSEAPSAEEKRVLDELVANEFADLLSELDELRVALDSFKSATDRLSSIKNRLVLSVEPICFEEQVDPSTVLSVEKEEVRRVFDSFGRVDSEATFAKVRDAEAIVLLRNLNLALRRKRARVLLVSRDKYIQRSLAQLSDDKRFNWPLGPEHLRTTEDLFLHLLVADTESADQWISEIEATIADFTTLAGSLQVAEDRLSSKAVEEHTQRLLESARSQWQRYVNLRLASAVGRLSWLADLDEPGREAAGAMHSTIQDLVRFVESEENRESIVGLVHQTWASFLSDGMWALFLQLFSKSEAARLVELVSEVHEDQRPKLVVTTSFATAVGSLQFKSDRYRRAVRALESTDPPKGGERRARALLLEVIAKILGRGREGGDYRPEAEDLLFLAFVLATMERWHEADRCAATALQLPGEIYGNEAWYLRAVCNRMLAVISRDPKLLEMASTFIQRAREARAESGERSPREESPRYLKEVAWIGLLGASWVKSQKHDEGTNEDRATSEGGAGKARQAAQDALSHVTNDSRLEVELLSLLAFGHAIEEEGDLADAVAALEEIDRVLDREPAGVTGRLSWKTPILASCRLFIEARVALRNEDQEGFRNALSVLRVLAEGEPVSATDRALIRGRLEVLESADPERTGVGG